MGTSILKRAKKFLQEKNRHKRWQVVMALLGILVVGATIYTLLMPALTMERKSYCGLEEHVHTEECYVNQAAGIEEKGIKLLSCGDEIHSHTEDCYNDEDELICGYADYAVHTHTDECYGEDGKLICPLEEIEVHKHTSECYRTVKGLICGEEERESHTHSDECYTTKKELTCGKAEAEGHTHDDGCYTVTEHRELTCGKEEGEEHTHDDGCYTVTEDKKLTCGKEESQGHTHNNNCYTLTEELTCGKEESRGHKHSDSCYGETKELICKEDEVILHEHDEKKCYDEDGYLICDMPEVKEHVHDENCFAGIEGQSEEPLLSEEPLCGLEEHTHEEECYIDPEDPLNMEKLNEEFLELGEEDREKVEHVRELIAALPAREEMEAELAAFEEAGDTEGYTAYCLMLKEQAGEAFRAYEELGDLQRFIDRDDVEYLKELLEQFKELEGVDSLPIADYLESASILVNGNPYNGSDKLNPGEQFEVQLQWELRRAQLETTKTYTYQFPEQIVIEDVEETVLFDKDNNRIGVYSVKDGELTVVYDKAWDLNVTNFKLKAYWNRDKIGTDTDISWNDDLNTTVHFNNSPIAATKKRAEGKEVTLEDGSLIWVYQVTVKSEADADNILLTDVMESDTFKFYPGYFEGGADYKITLPEGATYKKFAQSEGIDEADGAGASGTSKVIFEPFDLKAGQSCTIEYAVKLDGAVRAELDRWQTSTSLTNTATAVYKDEKNNEYSSVVTIGDQYWEEEKWVVKQRGELTKDDVTQKEIVPWTISINSSQNYDMGGSVVADQIHTEKVTYVTSNGMKVTAMDADRNTVWENSDVKWVTLPDSIVANGKPVDALWGTSVDAIFEQTETAAYIRQVLEQSIAASTGEKVTLSKENISSYVFVSESKQKFAWFAPVGNGKNLQYVIEYATDISAVESNVLSNSAAVNWKGLVSGDSPGSFLQEVEMVKENKGGDWVDGNYEVPWTITITVPKDRDAIPDVILYDKLPVHYNYAGTDEEVVDWLVGLKGTLDYQAVTSGNSIAYMDQLTADAIKISTDSKDPEVLALVQNAKTSLGHPKDGVQGRDLKYYAADEEAAALKGQLEIVNAEGTDYAGKRTTAAWFGVDLGTLPSTKGEGKDGYTITIEYTTRLNPALLTNLDGEFWGQNVVQMLQYINKNTQVKLGQADADYSGIHTIAKQALEKEVTNYDPESRVVTYQVKMNPDGDVEALDGAVYSLRDILEGVPGATYIEDSFKLIFPGKLGLDDPYPFTLDKSAKTVLWTWAEGVTSKDLSPLVNYGWSHDAGTDKITYNYDGHTTELSFAALGYMYDNVSLNVDNYDASSSGSNFNLSIRNLSNILHISPVENNQYKFVPLILEYKVQLPGIGESESSVIRNKASFKESWNGASKDLGQANTSFEFTSAMHKRLTTSPDKANGYVASFEIEIDKTAATWDVNDDYFNVLDTLSKSLEVDMDSIKVYGYDGRSESEMHPIKDLDVGDTWDDEAYYKVSYSDFAAADNTYLTIRIKNSSNISRYRIVYDARVKGEENTTVEYTNTAAIENSKIKSEEIEKFVSIQEHDGISQVFNYVIHLKKRDSENASVGLKVTFALYAYKDSGWELVQEGLTTDNNGELTLDSAALSEGKQLEENTWYALEETDAPAGYLKGVTYFYTRDNEKTEKSEAPVKLHGENQEDVVEDSLVTDIVYGNNKKTILNYKAVLKLRKIESEGKPGLEGAEFELHLSEDCADEAFKTVTSGADGSCSLDLDDLEPDTPYYLKEVKAPAGYICSDTIYTLTFDSQGKVTLMDGDEEVPSIGMTYQIPNDLSYMLPESGGMGMVLYNTIVGVFMVVGVGFIYMKKFRKGGKSSSRN